MDRVDLRLHWPDFEFISYDSEMVEFLHNRLIKT